MKGTQKKIPYFYYVMFLVLFSITILQAQDNPVEGLDSNLTRITNKIAIDSAWFVNNSDSIRVQWHIDLSAYPKDKPYFSGITLSIGKNFDNTLIPTNWDTISSETSISSVKLDSSKNTSDTSYILGIWILGYDGSIKTYTTIEPTDSSTYIVSIHGKDTNSVNITNTSVNITNKIVIDSAWFSNDSNSIRVQWHSNLSEYPEGRKYSSGITYSIGKTLDINDRPSIRDLETISSERCTSSIELDSSNLVFDTSYTIGIWIYIHDDSSKLDTLVLPTDSSTSTIKIPDFTWRKITLYPDNLDTILLRNNKIWFIFLQKNNRFKIPAIIRDYKLETDLPTGMREVGGTPFRFDSLNTQLPPFKLGMGFSKKTAGITSNSIAIYQIKNKKIYIQHNFETADSTIFITVTPKSGMMNYPFLILADQSPPKASNVTKSNGKSDIIDINLNKDSIPTLFRISDNIANVHWKFLYNSGKENLDNFVADTLDTTDTEIITYITENGNSRGSIISETFGVRALLIVSDGIYEDTIGASRCVKSDNVENISINPGSWIPISAASHLDTVDLSATFNRSYSGWSYDNRNFRLFIWYPVNPNVKDHWVEYSENNKELFTFLPGKLIWYKTTRDGFIKLGGGITIPLDKSYDRIILKAKNWTDISNPFAFEIKLRDILKFKANYDDISKNIEIYHWKHDGKKYHYDQVYIPEFHFEQIDTLSAIFDAHQGKDGYTVYNRKSEDHKFKIPPTCIPLSPAADTIKTSKRNTSGDNWVIDFRWKKRDNTHRSFYKRVRVGYKNNLDQPVKFGILPPSMSKITVGTYDSSSQAIRSWSLQKNMKNGGMIFDITINNSSSRDEYIEFYIDNLLFLPEHVKAAILNPDLLEYEIPKKTDPMGKQFYNDISVPSRVSLHRMLVIGSDDYLNYAKKLLTPYLFTFLKVYPNPFTKGINILYSIPVGTKEVHFTLYNMAGKQIHRKIEKNFFKQGKRVFYYDNNGNSQKGFEPVPSGMYILHLTAINKANRIMYGGKKRIICIK